MNVDKVYEKLVSIGDNYEPSVRNVTREELENETITLKDAFLRLYEQNDPLDTVTLINEIKRLNEDNERLRKVVQQMYETFKKKALKYIVNSNMDTEDLNLFKEIFYSYLK